MLARTLLAMCQASQSWASPEHAEAPWTQWTRIPEIQSKKLGEGKSQKKRKGVRVWVTYFLPQESNIKSETILLRVMPPPWHFIWQLFCKFVWQSILQSIYLTNFLTFWNYLTVIPALYLAFYQNLRLRVYDNNQNRMRFTQLRFRI